VSADPAPAGEHDEQLRQIVEHVRALHAYPAAELISLLAVPGLGDEARRAVGAFAALRILQTPQLGAELLPLLRSGRDVDVVFPGHLSGEIMLAQIKHAGAARKVSVSMPEELTSAVQRRVGRGKFSQYVTEAVARQLELDLLAELSELLAAEQGPVPEEYLAEARFAWPDDA
jgi:Arc/MetJ-type ribon-helix-helix transcriptional regulator